MKKLIFLTFVLFWGCSGAGVVNLKTIPSSANIKVLNNGGEITDLGVSPLNASTEKLFSNSNYVQLLIEKEDFKPERIVITRPYLDTNFDLSVELKQAINNSKSNENLEKVSIKIAEVYRKIQSKELSNAYSDLKELQVEFPRLSVVNDLLGNISYLNGNYEQAKEFYLKADSIQPNNFERAAILKKIQQKVSR